jgi:hypothetical protein
MNDTLGDEELLAAIEAITGPQLRPVPGVDAMVAIAIGRRLRKVLGPMFTALRAPPADWSNEEIARLLSWFSHVGLREYQMSAGNETEIRLVKTLGVRPGCFAPATGVLIVVGPGDIAAFAAQHAAAMWARGGADSDIVPRLAELYDDPRLAPHRLELLKALSSAPEDFKQSLRDALGSVDRSAESMEAIATALAGAQADPSYFARELAATFLTSDGGIRELLLPHPADHKHAFIRPSLAHCIRMFEQILEVRRNLVSFGQPEHTVMAQFPEEVREALRAALDRAPVTIDRVAEAEPLEQPQHDAGSHGGAFAVSVRLHADGAAAEEHVLIHRIGDRFRVGVWNAVEHALLPPPAPEATRPLGDWQAAFSECVRSWRELVDEVVGDNPQASMQQIAFGLRQRFIDYPGDWMLDRESIAGLDPSSRLRAPEFLLDVLRHTGALPQIEQPRRRPIYVAAMEALARISDPARAGTVAEAINAERLSGGRSTGSSLPRTLEVLRATAARSACTCDHGRSGDPADHADIVVQGRERTGAARDVMTYEVHLDCRCTSCGARWRVTKSVDWERRSAYWRRISDSR